MLPIEGGIRLQTGEYGIVQAGLLHDGNVACLDEIDALRGDALEFDLPEAFATETLKAIQRAVAADAICWPLNITTAYDMLAVRGLRQPTIGYHQRQFARERDIDIAA
jgi:hypothetical protein